MISNKLFNSLPEFGIFHSFFNIFRKFTFGFSAFHAHHNKTNAPKYLNLPALAVFLLIFVTLAYAVPNTMNFQAKLTDSSNVLLTDTYNFTFRIFNVATGGTYLWSENQVIYVDNGIVNALLGNNTALNLSFDESYWLEIRIGSETLTPRRQLATSGYAFRANTSEDLVCTSCVDSSDIASSAVTASKIASGAVTSAKLSTDLALVGNLSVNTTILFVDSVLGRVGIGTTTPLQVFDVRGNTNISGFINVSTLFAGFGSASAPSIAFAGDTTTGIFRIGSSQLAFTTGGSTKLTINGSNVGIGTTNPITALDVRGDLNVSGIINGSLADNIVTSSSIAANAVTASKIASGAVTSAKLASDLALTGNLSVNTSVLFVDSVLGRVGVLTTSPITTVDIRGNLNVTGYVNTSQVCIGSVCRTEWPSAIAGWATTATLVYNDTPGVNVSIGSSSAAPAGYKVLIVGGLNVTGNINGSYVGTLGANTVDSAAIQSNAVTASKIASGAVTSAKLSSDLTLEGNLSAASNLFYVANNTRYVGINTTAPTQTLTVIGTANITGGASSVVGLVVNTTGGVGVGTGVPISKLHVLLSDTVDNSVSNVLTLTHTTPSALGGSFSPDTNNNLTTNIVNYYKMDESGTSVTDSVGSNTGTSNGTASVTGKISTGRDFNGINNSIDVSTATFPSGDFTIAMWVYPRSFAVSGQHQRRLFHWYNGTNQLQAYVYASSSNVSFDVASSAVGSEAGTALSKNVWTHLVFVRKGSSYKIYFNGTEQPNITSAVGDPSPSVSMLRIGADIAGTGTNGFFNGTIDEVGVWLRALSNQEITDLYNSGAGNTYTILSGIGTGLFFQSKDSVNDTENIGRISSIFTNAANTSETSAMAFETRVGGGALTERVRITGGGAVGINTTTPIEALDVRGNLNVSGTINGSYVGTLGDNTVTSASIATNAVTASKIASGAVTSAKLSQDLTLEGNLSAGSNIFYVANNTRFVGINTTTPTQTLTVVGTANITGGNSATLGLIINSTGSVAIGNGTPKARLDVNGDIIVNKKIGLQTADGADNDILTLVGGGIAGDADTRGADIHLYGNEQGSYPGRVFIDAGRVSNSEINFRGGSNFATWAVFDTNGNFGINATSPSGRFHIGISGSPLIVTQTGNLGVGTASPTAKLHVTSDGELQNTAVFYGYRDTYGMIMNFYGAQGTPASPSNLILDQRYIQFSFSGYVGGAWQTSAAINVRTDTTGTLGGPLFSIPSVITFDTAANGTSNPIERLRIGSAGNIGINTTTPTALLSLKPGANVVGLNITGTGTQVNHYLSVESSTGSSLFVINSTGNVGIGTASPITTLDVRGNVNATGYVNATGIYTSGNIFMNGNSIKNVALAVSTQLSPNITAYWPFEEGLGTAVRDASFNGNDGTTNATWVNSGRFGRALAFDGIDDRVRIPKPLANQNFTVEAWVYFRGGPDGTIISDRVTGSANVWQVQTMDDQRFNFNWGAAGNGTTFTSSFPKNAWTHVVVVVNGTSAGGRAKAWVNGVGGTAQPIDTLAAPGSVLWIGSYDTSGFFNGTIDEVKLWNVALSDEEAVALYRSANPLGQIIVNSTGNSYFVGGGLVGINTTTPTQTLTVVGTANITGGGASTLGLFVNGGNVSIGSDTTHDRLHVYGGNITYTTGSTTAGSTGGIRFMTSTSTTAYSAFVYAERDSTDGSSLLFGTTSATGASTPPTERMRIDRNGNVGINNTSPAETLDINGAMHILPQPSPPATANSGDIYVDSTPAPDELCFYDGSAWQGISSGTDANCA